MPNQSVRLEEIDAEVGQLTSEVNEYRNLGTAALADKLHRRAELLGLQGDFEMFAAEKGITAGTGEKIVIDLAELIRWYQKRGYAVDGPYEVLQEVRNRKTATAHSFAGMQ
ncbi:hypothetical protein BBD42_27040 [Paenibacillus sp. BIHB 4019]|uniref:Uncharacterized protein n=1 Tax=Paenibacillus sp. BIHB 4019 TaxID=1870819 RepID=A0A1B2DPW3_9BACL|nr:hypothetical protein [Paenibacillus sp. BIHB 4019]ANY69740.1 hypothetical protein BBD42_27040 [Paenibacillus sp. BIHB 4019]